MPGSRNYRQKNGLSSKEKKKKKEMIKKVKDIFMNFILLLEKIVSKRVVGYIHVDVLYFVFLHVGDLHVVGHNQDIESHQTYSIHSCYHWTPFMDLDGYEF